MALAARLLFNLRSKIQNQQSDWLAFVHKDSDITLRLSQEQGALKGCQSQGKVPLALVGKRLDHQISMTLPVLVCASAAFNEALQHPDYLQERAPALTALNFGHQHSGQGEIFELAQVADFVVRRQPALTRPFHSPGQPAFLENHLRLQGFDGTGNWDRVLDIHAPGFIQQDQGSIQVSTGRFEPGLGKMQR